MLPPLTLSLSKGQRHTLPPLWFDKLTMSGSQIIHKL